MNFPQSQQPTNNIFLNELNLDATKPGEENINIKETQCLHSSLECYEDFINRLISELKSLNESKKTINNNSIINIIQNSSAADYVTLLVKDNQEKWNTKLNSDFNENLNEKSYLELAYIFCGVDYESSFNPEIHGTYRIYQDTQGYSKAAVIIPLKKLPLLEVMIIFGLEAKLYFLTDIYAKIVSSFYKASQNKIIYPEIIEAEILDDLKCNFGFISSTLYQRRLDLFCQRLKQMVVYYEPVLHLEPDDLFISGWEALARNPESFIAPSDLFTSAELWGSRFIIELDQHFLRVACDSYRHARKIKQRRASDIVPLSVNVYPQSLMRVSYFETLQEILKEQIISPRNLILEISEKSELPHFHNGIRLKNPLQSFKNRLVEYVSQLKVHFAIDDFGVGYASVSRLAGLNPSHVKIDRELLQHDASHIIIRFVHELVGANNLNPSKVIVEGIDETVSISLRTLKEIGVSYVQGHIIGKPEPEVYRLSQDKYDELKKRLLH
jgi:EAL domain-containing protein (putative c-di-GMP-specific phosphodiesterase class I)